MVKSAIKSVLKKFIRRNESWAIGIYEADSNFNFKPAPNVKNPVIAAKHITDVKAEFVADPFMLYENGVWHMFFEVLDATDNLGDIALATSLDGIKWNYQKVVLEEPFHLSYPYVFKWENDYYMIPETYQSREVRLYKATHFPEQWSLEKILLKDSDYVDASIVHFNGRWWIFSSTTANDILRLHHADSLLGEWTEHPSSPLITNNPHLARPAGRVVNLNNKLIRFAQDDQPTYGLQVYGFEITDLTPHSYAERALLGGKAIVEPSGSGWNSVGMHHIDLHEVNSNQWIACVDAKGRPTIRAFGLVI